MHRINTVILLTVGLLFGPGLKAQTHIPLTFAPETTANIDGEATPDLIPDGLAWRVFLRAVSEPNNATQAQLSRLLTKINRVGLSSTDTATFISVLARVDGEIKEKDIELAAIQATTPNGKATIVSLSKGIDDVVATAVDDLSARLSADGMARLQKHVVSIKAKMRVVSLPSMPE